MKPRMIALTLTLTLTLTLLLAAAVSAFAVEPAASSADTTPTSETEQQDAANIQTETAVEDAVIEDAAAEATAAENAAAEDATTGDAAADTVETEAVQGTLLTKPLVTAPEGQGKTVKFHELEDLVKKKNLSYRSLQGSIAYMVELENTVDTLNATIQQIQASIAALDPAAANYAEIRAQMQTQLVEAQQAKASISAMIQDTSQMEKGRDQLVYGAETLFIALVGMERQETTLERQLAALDRTMEELKVRAKWGQVSELQVKEAESGRESLVSGLETLRMNITSYKMKLEQMIGEKPAGTLQLGALPAVTAEELNALDLEKDLKKAKAKNHDLHVAAESEASAYDAATQMPGMMAAVGHLIDAANSTYKETEQQVELKFQLLCLQLQDQCQVLAAAETALETETKAYQAQELKYQKGTISQNALLTAKDELKTAQETVQTAKDNLFSIYNNYRWAVDRGVLN